MSDLKDQVVKVLRTIYDPEIPIDIYELGLIYGVEAAPDGAVKIRMTLTAPNCPVAESLPAEVRRRVSEVPGVGSVAVELVFDPPWTKDSMSDAAKLALGIEDVVSIRPVRR